MHLGGYCPGCGGGEGHQSCAVIRCSREQGEMDYCFECAQFPCPRYDSLTEYDSFIPHRHMVRDLKRVQQILSLIHILHTSSWLMSLKYSLIQGNTRMPALRQAAITSCTFWKGMYSL